MTGRDWAPFRTSLFPNWLRLTHQFLKNSILDKPEKKEKPKKEKKVGGGGGGGGGGGKGAEPEAPVDIGRLDLRVGHIRSAKKHPDADSLYVEEVSCTWSLYYFYIKRDIYTSCILFMHHFFAIL